MEISLLLQLCGLPLLVTLLLVEMLLIGVASWLVFSARRDNLLQMFLPITAIPIVVGLFNTTVGFLTSISFQVDDRASYSLDPSFLLQMNMVPLLVGCVAALPAATIVIIGRWHLAWQASGLRLIPEKKVEPPETEMKRVKRDADDYIEKLVKTR